MSSALSAVSLFSNCGAGDLGYASAGFDFKVMAELDERRLSVAELNVPDAIPVPGDLRKTWPKVVTSYRSRSGATPPDLLAACPPCQGMSSARSGLGSGSDPVAGSSDERNLLVTVIAQVALELRPRVIVVENVPAFLTRVVQHPKDDYPISAAALLARSLRQGYRLVPMVADLADYGVPQSRRRAFLCFLRRDDERLNQGALGGKSPFPHPSHASDSSTNHVTLREALAALGAGPLDAKSTKTAGEGMHRVPVWSAEHYEMISTVPANSGKGAWDNDKCLACQAVAAQEEAVCGSCGSRLPRPTVQEEGDWRLIKGFRSSSYRRMDPNRPAATITTATGHMGSDRTIHPSQNRVLSPLECAHLQTFPTDFDWGDALEKWGATNVRAMIGEAVPPQFTSQHGEVLAALLRDQSPPGAMDLSDPRVRRAQQTVAHAERSARRAAHP